MLGTALAESGDRRTLAVGLYDNPPKIFLDEDGAAAGFFTEILDHIAQSQGLEIFYVPCARTQCLQMVRRGEIDIMPDVALTRERERVLRFGGEPVLQSWSNILYRVDLGRRIETIDDIEGLRVAVLENSLEARELNALRERRGISAEMVMQPSLDAVLSSVRSGAVDAGIVNRYYAEARSETVGVRRSPVIFQPSALYFVFSPGVEEALIRAFDSGVTLLKGDPESVYYRALDDWLRPQPLIDIARWAWIVLIVFAGMLTLSLAANAYLRHRVAASTAALRESQNRLKAIFDNAPVELYLKDGEGRFVEVNKEFERLFNVCSDEIRGKLPHEVHYAALAERTRAHDLHILRTGETYVREEHAVTEAGPRILHTVKFPIFDEHDRIAGVGAVVSDVTEQHRVRDRVAEIERQLAEAVNALPDGFVLFDALDRLVVCNQRYRDLYALSADAIVPGATFESILRRGLENGQYPEARGHEEEWLEWRLSKHRAADAAVQQRLPGDRWVKIVERRTEDGGYVGFRVDITDVKRHERALEIARERAEDTAQQLREQTRKLKQVVEISGVGGWELDLATGRLSWDAIARSIHEVSPDYRPDLPSAVRFFVPDARPVMQQAIHDCVERLEPFDLELELNTATGRSKWLRVKGQPVIEEGTVDRLTGVFRDITEQKRHERALVESRLEAEKANVAKSQFLANMSHEIRTPMNGVTGMLALLLNSALDERQRMQAQTAFDSAAGLMQVLNDILDYSKLEANAMRIEAFEYRIEAVVEEVVGMLGLRAAEKGLTLVTELDPDIPGPIVGDPARVRQVLVNLVGNAVKFTDAGSVRIRVESPRYRGGVLRISVVDTGIGISEAQQATLFERFAQADGSITRQYGGTGLGLAISKQLVEALGGRIGLESTPGRGSRFWFTLPQRIVSDAPVAVRAEPEETRPSAAVIRLPTEARR